LLRQRVVVIAAEMAVVARPMLEAWLVTIVATIELVVIAGQQ
jgi:hypothetical protein